MNVYMRDMFDVASQARFTCFGVSTDGSDIDERIKAFGVHR